MGSTFKRYEIIGVDSKPPFVQSVIAFGAIAGADRFFIALDSFYFRKSANCFAASFDLHAWTVVSPSLPEMSLIVILHGNSYEFPSF